MLVIDCSRHMEYDSKNIFFFFPQGPYILRGMDRGKKRRKIYIYNRMDDENC